MNLSKTVLCSTLFIVVACVLGEDKGLCKGPLEKPKPRQVIIITLDTTRADHFGCYGNKKIKTPNLDALARDSVLFENCFSAANQTGPSHASILMSLYQKDHRVFDNQTRLPDDPRVMSRIFKSAGYATAAFTSVDHLSVKTNFNQGFDYFTSGDKPTRKADETNASVFKWLASNHKSDFFIWIHYFDAHLPYDPPSPYDKMYNGASNQRVDFVSTTAIKYKKLRDFYTKYFSRSKDPEYYRNLYKGGISYQDGQLGRLFNKLKALGIYDNCYIIVVADHGESLGEHNQYWCHEDLYDINVHVPLLIKLKEKRETGRRKQLVSSIDIYPTILSLAKIKVKDPIRGKSLVDIINDPSHPEIHNEVYYQYGNDKYVGIKTRDYTHILLVRPDNKRVSTEKMVKHELYDNRNDEEQVHDIRRNQKDLAAFDNKALSYLKDRIKVKPTARVSDKETIEKLKSLGYIH